MRCWLFAATTLAVVAVPLSALADIDDDSGQPVDRPTNITGVRPRDGAAVADGKKWNVGTILETHQLFVREDLNGAGKNKALNYYYFFTSYYLTKLDRVQARWGLYQRYLADDGESGLRSDDGQIHYQHTVELPYGLAVRGIASVILPLAYRTRMGGMIVAPRGGAQLDGAWGDFSLSLRGLGTAYVHRYRTTPGGEANPKYQLASLLNLEYAMPFHRKLSVGVIAYTAANWQYNVEDADDPNVRRYGATTDPQFGNKQPMQQDYGGQIYVRYQLPNLDAFQSELSLAYANGDATLGYNSMIHDGVPHLYGTGWRQTRQVIVALSARY
jgi:hypothetical protein